jgi:hypothetical protein
METSKRARKRKLETAKTERGTMWMRYAKQFYGNCDYPIRSDIHAGGCGKATEAARDQSNAVTSVRNDAGDRPVANVVEFYIST